MLNNSQKVNSIYRLVNITSTCAGDVQRTLSAHTGSPFRKLKNKMRLNSSRSVWTPGASRTFYELLYLRRQLFFYSSLKFVGLSICVYFLCKFNYLFFSFRKRRMRGFIRLYHFFIKITALLNHYLALEQKLPVNTFHYINAAIIPILTVSGRVQ